MTKKGMIEGRKSKIFAWIFSIPFMLGNLERWRN